MKYILSLMLILTLFVGIGSAATITVGFSGDGADYTCDGNRDEVEINAALAEIAGTGGTVKLIGGNTYIISKPIKIGDKSILTGDSNAVVKLVNDAGWNANVGLIENSGSSGDITISGFEINGNYAHNNEHGRGSYYYTLIDLEGVDAVTIRNMYLHNNANDLIKLTNCDNVKIANNAGTGQGHEFAYIYLCDNVKIHGNDIDIDSNAGIRCELSNHLNIHNNEIYSSDNSGYTGIYVQSYSRNNPVTSVNIHDNEIHDTNAAGIYVVALHKSSYPLNDKSQASGVSIYNNVLYNTNKDDWDAPGGAISTAGFSNTVIENNVIYNSKNNGINIQYTYNAPDFDDVDYYICDNIIMNCEGYAIYNSLGDTHNAIVQYNDMYGNTKGTTHGSGFSIANSNIYENPLFSNAENADFHLKSTAGRWTGSSWTKDSVDSPCIDTGNPSYGYSNEPDYNGDRINIGAYGNREKASKSVGTAPVANEAPTAKIISISHDTVTEGEPVSFKGSGSDSDGSIVAYRWDSKPDGTINKSASFSTSELSAGEHIIYFSVLDDSGEWSEEVSSTVTVNEAVIDEERTVNNTTSENEEEIVDEIPSENKEKTVDNTTSKTKEENVKDTIPENKEKIVDDTTSENEAKSGDDKNDYKSPEVTSSSGNPEADYGYSESYTVKLDEKATVYWMIDGVIQEIDSDISQATFEYQPTEAGDYTISANVTDGSNWNNETKWTVNVFKDLESVYEGIPIQFSKEKDTYVRQYPVYPHRKDTPVKAGTFDLDAAVTAFWQMDNISSETDFSISKMSITFMPLETDRYYVRTVINDGSGWTASLIMVPSESVKSFAGQNVIDSSSWNTFTVVPSEAIEYAKTNSDAELDALAEMLPEECYWIEYSVEKATIDLAKAKFALIFSKM